MRHVANLGHFGAGNLEITLTKSGDFEGAKPHLELGYGHLIEALSTVSRAIGIDCKVAGTANSSLKGR